MPIQILSTFTRKGIGNYPLVDEGDVRGGFRAVPTIIARDAIQTALRKEGMHVYVTTTDTTYRLLADLSSWVVAMSGGGGPATANIGIYGCLATLLVLDVVYVSGNDTVGKADADGAGTQPVIGFVLEKMTLTTAKVQYSGELEGFSDLVAGTTYYLSTTPGQITATAPSAPGAIVQRVGFAKNPTTLVVMVDRDYTIL